jgi:hypothetical protein
MVSIKILFFVLYQIFLVIIKFQVWACCMTMEPGEFFLVSGVAK